MFSSQFVTVPTHPVLWCTISYGCGIICAYQDIAPYILFATSASALLIFSYASLKAVMTWQTLLILFLVSISFNLGSWRYNRVQNRYKNLLIELTRDSFDCIGTITNIQKRTKKAFKTVITLNVYSIERASSTSPLKATIQLHSISSPHFHVGDVIKVRSLTIKQSKNHSFESYLFKEGICASIFLPRLQSMLLARPSISLARWAYTTRKRIAKSIKHKLSPTANALIGPLFLGQKPESASYDLIKKHCSFWGIVHYLARSGLHVVLILSAWDFLLRSLAINFFIKQIILLLLILIYHVLTVTSISFLRALITFILYKLCIVQSLSYKTLHILSLTTYAVLLYNPLQLFFLDFQLSFGLTFALAWFNEAAIKIQRFYNTIENN